MRNVMRFAFTFVLVLFAVVAVSAQERDEMNGVTITGSVSAQDDHTNEIQVTLKNNNSVTAKNIRYEISYTCGKTITKTKSFDSMPAKYVTTFGIDVCMKMTGDGPPQTTIERVRIINVDLD
jgi:hypothetical protein